MALCIIAEIALGHWFPAPFQTIGRLEIAKVNLPVAVLIWLMIIPMLLKIDVGALHQVREHWRGIGVTLFINWAVKPFSMALLGRLFIGGLFRPWLPANQIDSYIAGLIILAAAPWHGHGVRLVESVRWRAAFHTVPGRAQRHHHGGRVRPVIVAQLWRALLLRRGADALAQTLKTLQPVSLLALLATLVLLFGFQGEQILNQPLIIAMLAVPILIQVYVNAGLAYLLNRQIGVAHCVAAPSALIGASNFFELAVATAIVLFGFNSGAALATVVGVLVEVPVMLSVVHITVRSKNWYERAL